MQDQAYIGRQPIIDSKQAIIGYELLPHPQNKGNPQSLINLLGNEDTGWPLGDKLVFLKLSSSQLMGDLPEKIVAQRIALAISSTASPDEDLVARCQKLRGKGYLLALDDVDPDQPLSPLAEIASFIRIKGHNTTSDKIGALINALKGLPVKLLATGVETREDFNRFSEMGFSHFQGFYFTHPENLNAKVINPAYANVLDVLKKVRDNAEVKEIEISFKRDVALSFKLLRYINSVGFGLSCEIQSIRHGLAILGYQQLYRWLTLLLVTAKEDDSSPPALLRTAITRGRLTELLGQEHLEPKDRDNLFIVGVFSLLDAMLEMPMDKVLDKLFLPESVIDALQSRQGIYGPFLELAEACEHTDLARMENLAFALQLMPDRVNQAHLEALAWVEKLGV